MRGSARTTNPTVSAAASPSSIQSVCLMARSSPASSSAPKRWERIAIAPLAKLKPAAEAMPQ